MVGGSAAELPFLLYYYLFKPLSTWTNAKKSKENIVTFGYDPSIHMQFCLVKLNLMLSGTFEWLVKEYYDLMSSY